MKLSKYQLLEYMISCIIKKYSQYNETLNFKIIYQHSNSLYSFNTYLAKDITIKQIVLENSTIKEYSFEPHNYEYIKEIRQYINRDTFEAWEFVNNPSHLLEFCLQYIDKFSDVTENLTYLYNFQSLDTKVQLNTYLNANNINFIPVSLTVEPVEYSQN